MNNPDNRIQVAGILEGGLTISHEVMHEPFYTGILAVKRLSDTIDRLPITIPGKLMGYLPQDREKPIRVDGQIRTYNRADEGAGRMMVTVFVTGIYEGQAIETTNQATITGALRRPPVYRVTPFGREICDFMLTVNRAFGKSEYIPCIVWGHNARYISKFGVGERVWLTGRLQSREYEKQLENGEYETRTAYEVSAFNLGKAGSEAMAAGLYADRDAAQYADAGVLMPAT